MKPILFSTEVVRAILAGRKIQTRRVIKPQPLTDANIRLTSINGILHIIDTNFTFGEDLGGLDCTYANYVPLPYQPGDILWVRETFYHAYATTTVNGLEYVLENTYYYKADYPSDKLNPPWLPSIHMPREVARIFLRVTNVRVERLQNISFDDAIAEGMGREGHIAMGISCPESEEEFNFKRYPERLFRRIWDNLNAKRGYGWDTNPWVWVIEFQRISKDEALKQDKAG